ncbi:MAG: hypothetical protein Kow00124_26410 [Anaerolineae bacterium]
MSQIDHITYPTDLSHLSKMGQIAFLKSARPDKVALWNAWREGNKRRPLNLRGAQLQYAGLRGIDLRWCDLSGADLFEADLSSAQFYQADLTGAQLDGADLDKASLRKAKLDKACLDGATLRRADLYEASLCSADLSEADLRGANLNRAQLCGADLRWARLDHANLRWANLRDVALSSIGSMQGVLLYETSFSGVLSLRREQFLGENSKAAGLRRAALRLTNRLYESSIWEEQQGRFAEAADIFASLKGYFEDSGDYQAANWAYEREKVMKKMLSVPKGLRWLYPRWRGRPDYRFRPDVLEWLGLEFSEKIANYGNSLSRPLMWLAITIVVFAVIYWAGGLITATPGCGYVDRAIEGIDGCRASRDFSDALLFSLGAMSTIDAGDIQPFVPHLGLLTSLEALIGITLTGLLGFVLGNKLRFS